MSATMSVTALAAEPNVKVSTNVTGEPVYTQTVDVQLSAAPNASSSRTVRASQSLWLALAPGKSGFSDQVSFRFTSLPLNAKVKSIEIDPGRGIINNNNKNLLGAVVFSKLNVSSPSGKSATIAWKPSGMTERASFLDQEARGKWTAQVFGTTFQVLPEIDGTAAFSYKPVEMTISYVLE
ncbi:hypothetical protein ACFQ5D_16115 [Paenibacillus farraposensis]|uniref:Uncharacterized protein n=3 Tax=Paenibacillus farraposensis TaxID=2807095 RepID=A0ABW4DGJ6_9BACL|nr:hypothetical protein [Paenibacillus farraposensis]